MSAAIADVRIGPSPDWLQARLTACGVRPISNVVDVTNYVLLELGHPMHAFDLARLRGPAIVVRRARPGETIKTLDGKERALEPRHAGDCRRRARVGDRRRHGRRRVRGLGQHDADRLRERVVQAAIGARHQQAAWACARKRRTASSAAPISRRRATRWTARSTLLEAIGAGAGAVGRSSTAIPRRTETRELTLDAPIDQSLLGMDVPGRRGRAHPREPWLRRADARRLARRRARRGDARGPDRDSAGSVTVPAGASTCSVPSM